MDHSHTKFIIFTMQQPTALLFNVHIPQGRILHCVLNQIIFEILLCNNQTYIYSTVHAFMLVKMGKGLIDSNNNETESITKCVVIPCLT